MTTHATGPLAGLTWLKRGVNLGRQNARAVFGGAAILMVMWLMPGLVQVALLSALQPGPVGTSVIGALATLLALFLLMPLVGGYLRVIEASEAGRAVHATDIFAPFRHVAELGRFVGFGAIMSVASTALFLALLWLVGDGVAEWFDKVMALSMSGAKVEPAQIPQAPESLGRLVFLGSLLGLVLSGVYALGLGQIALGRRPVREALVDGVKGTFKNLIPMLVLAIVVFLLSIVLGVVLALAVGLISVVGKLVGMTVATVLVLVSYFALIIALYVVLFGVMYYFWRDVCDGQEPPPLRNDQVAL